MNKGMIVHAGNALDILIQKLTQELRAPLSSPFKREVIVVQSRGMERWLGQQLALSLGITAGIDFLFPNAFLNSLFHEILGLQEDPGFAKDMLCFHIMDLLEGVRSQPAFAGLDTYLEGDAWGMKRYGLCRMLADTFDQYLLFRPQLLHEWRQNRRPLAHDPEAAALEGWQAGLWEGLCARSADSRAELGLRLLERLSGPQPPDLPGRISIFGVSWLPPIHSAIFEALAQSVPVHLYMLSPCREYWALIRSRREQDRMTRGNNQTPAEQYFEEGNRLLASFGSQGRAFMDRIVSSERLIIHEEYRDINPDTLLHAVQADILGLSHPDAPRQIREDDDSVQIHACHSVLREVETLHAQLLDCFERLPDLRPEEILVMAPNMADYAPAVQAVFSHAAQGAATIPFSIADTPQDQAPLIQAFFKLLQASLGRLESREVMDILAAPPISARFGISADDLAQIHAMVAKARIYWGEDAAAKQAQGLPGEHANTWRFGLERLLLGAIMPSGGELFETPAGDAILPVDDIEGDSALLLGRFAHFAEKLAAFVKTCRLARGAKAWSALLLSCLHDFIEPESGAVWRSLNTCLHRLAQLPWEGELDVRVILRFLEDNLSYPSEGGFLAGGVTFCSMLPMRSIPFRVICLLGLDHDAYPRRQPHTGLDLMALGPQPGDRNRRDDDRYLFLEALISAKDIFYLSYIGQDITDNTERPPSVLVNELLDYLETFSCAQTACGSANAVSKRLVRTHRLHAFSPRYFMGDARYFSYAHASALAARALFEPALSTPAFITRPLPPLASEELATLDVGQFLRFFEHPVRFFLEQRLGMSLPREEQELEIHEPFTLSGLERYTAGTRTMETLLQGRDPFAYLKAEGLLPHGAPGLVARDKLISDFAPMLEQLQKEGYAGLNEKKAIDIQLGATRLQGVLAASAQGLILFRPGELRAKDYISLWLRHLLLNTAGSSPSVFYGLKRKDGETKIEELRFHPLDPHAILQQLMQRFHQGLNFPLGFYPQSSLAFAQGERKTEPSGLSDARKVWEGGQLPGEGANAWYAIHPGEKNPFNSDFKQLALEFFSPLLDAGEDA